MAADLHTTKTVAEHVVGFKFKDGYTYEQEIDMYKGLWSFKDYFRSIMAMSLGRVLAKNADDVTHVLVMRFASKEALQTYMDDDYRIEIAHKTIVPFYNGELVVDFEAEVTTDLCELYKESERFNEGVEHVELFKFKEGTSSFEIEELMKVVADLPKNVQTDVVQLSSGANYRPSQKYTHGFVARLPSVEGLQALMEDPSYVHVSFSSPLPCLPCHKFVQMSKKVNPFLDDHLSVDFKVEDSKKQIHGGHSS